MSSPFSSSTSPNFYINCSFLAPPPPHQHPTATLTSNDPNSQTLNLENPLQIQQQPQLIIHYHHHHQQHQLSENPSTVASSLPASASVTTNHAPPIIDVNNPPTLHTLYHNIHKQSNVGIEKQQAIDKKFQLLMEKFNPVSFVPSKNLDFLKHENMLKRLGLWDFARMEFDAVIRMDLIAELVASYDPKFQCSYVKGTRITVNRSDLARAMKLPLNKKSEMDLESSEESITFIVDFLSNWVLLHGDTWSAIPTEVLSCVSMIMDGHPEKVDWAGLLWFMVENELTRGEHLESCYYASHLQCLIKSQSEEVFLNGDPEKMELVGQVREEEEGNVHVAHKEKSIALSGPDIDLNLDQDGGVNEQVTNVDESSMELLGSKSDVCNANLAGPSHYENSGKRVIVEPDFQTLMDEEFEERIQKRVQKMEEEIHKRDEEILRLEREINGKQKVTETPTPRGKCRKGYELEDGTSGSNKRLRINKYIGAYKTSSGCSWMSQIYSSKLKRYIYLGCHPSAEVAARAYDAVNLWINGFKVKLNFPMSYSLAHLPPDDTVMSVEAIKSVAASAASAAEKEAVKIEEE